MNARIRMSNRENELVRKLNALNMQKQEITDELDRLCFDAANSMLEKNYKTHAYGICVATYNYHSKGTYCFEMRDNKLSLRLARLEYDDSMPDSMKYAITKNGTMKTADKDIKYLSRQTEALDYMWSIAKGERSFDY